MKYLEVCLQTSIFAPLFNRKRISLDYGVMVAQQVLVLFVQVRILVVQRKKLRQSMIVGAFFISIWKVCRNARCTFFLVYHRYKSVYFLQAAIIRRFL